MATDDCLKIIREAAGDALDEDEIGEIMDALNRRIDTLKARSGLASVEEEILQAADDMAKDIVEAAAIFKRNRYLNILRRSDALGVAAEADLRLGDPSLGLEARNVGINSTITGAGKSVDAVGDALQSSYMGGLIADLERAGLKADFNSNRLEREIAVELAEITKPDGKPGISGSKEARQIAGFIDKQRRASVARENRAGAWIRRLPGYIVRQSHDMHRIRRAGYQAWREKILPLLDHERTFADVDDTEKFLRGAYDGLVTGIHMKANGADESDLTFAFKGPGNLAKRISQHRVLHFSGADEWLEYNKAFGHGTLTEALTAEFDRAARNTALMEAWGPNPRAMFDDVRETLLKKHRSDLTKVDRLKRESLDHQFAEIDGTARIPVAPTLARVAAMVRAVQSMAKLGMAAISALSDTVFTAAARRYQGRNLLSAWGDTFTGFMDGVTPGERRIVADLIGTGLEGQIGDIGARFGAQDDWPGVFSKAMQRFFKLNLLGPWTDAHKRGMGLMMARDLAMQSDRSFDALPTATRRLLERYDISADRWDIARQAVVDAPDGRTYLMPDAIRDLPDSAFGATRKVGKKTVKMTARQIQGVKDEIETSLRAYFVDQADFASPTPGARERAIMRRGTQPGTPIGEALRFVMQFKSFPITVLTKPVGRDIYGHGATSFSSALLKGEGDVLGLVHMMVGTTVLGYVAQSAKEMAKGRTPRDPASPATWQAAFLQGGGAGIYGDFLLGESNRFGRSLLDTLAGPTIGTISDIDELRARLMAGDDVAASAFRTVLSNTPGMNLPYVRIGLDYLMFYEIQEALNPGYLRRMERRIERENNQRFLLPPSQIAG